MTTYSCKTLVFVAVFLPFVSGCGVKESSKNIELLNVSYDPTRELWRDLNKHFSTHYERETGTKVTIKQSHGGSSTQARAVIDGLDADVVSLALWSDTDAIRKKGLIADDWEKRLPDRSLPYTSSIVFVVRKGNPKGIKDWPDLVKPNVTANPKTSGNGQLSFYAAYWLPFGTRRARNLHIARHKNGQPTWPARITRIHAAGTQVRLDLQLTSEDRAVEVVLSQERFAELALKNDEAVFVTPTELKVFEGGDYAI